MQRIEAKLKDITGKAEVEQLLKQLISISERPQLHAVYSDPAREDNWSKSHLAISKSKFPGRFVYSEMPFIHPIVAANGEYEIDGKTYIGSAKKMPYVLEKFDPRRIIIQNYSIINQVDKYIKGPYEFIGFEVNLPDLGIKVFASSRDRKAGMNIYKSMYDKHDIKQITNSLRRISDSFQKSSRVVN